jgi:DNA-binding YbaB/EbfC family protein
MLDALMGNMEEFQAQLKEKLSGIELHAEAGDGAVKVTANALRQITNISLDQSKLDTEDPEQLEDLLLVAINRALEQAAETEAAESKAMMQNMLPPGLGGLSGLFGQ